jgi:hypothetical protein
LGKDAIQIKELQTGTKSPAIDGCTCMVASEHHVWCAVDKDIYIYQKNLNLQKVFVASLLKFSALP